MSRLSTWFCAALLACGAIGEADALDFTASVDRTEATTGDAIRLTLTLSSSGNMGHVPSPTLDLRDFSVYGPSVATRVEMINGRTTFARDLVYTMYGRQPGRFRIGPAVIELADTTLTTKPIEVRIRKGGSRQSARAQPGGSERVVFVRAVADRDTAWVGEQIVVRYELAYRLVPRDVGFADIPDFTGFWQKELFVAQRLSPQREIIDGVAYNVAPLRRLALFPTTAGDQTIEPLAVSCSIPQGSRGSLYDALSLFDDPIFGRGQNVVVRSDPLTIHVKPLPEAGRPADFGGAVGRFDLKAQARPLRVPVGDPVTLKLEIQGSGNVQSIPEPRVAIPGFEVYPPTVEVEEGQTEEGRYGARKNLEYILIPERGGQRQLPALSVSYFDPVAAAYRTVSTAPFDIDVAADPSLAAAGPTLDLTRSEIERLGSDIRHIKPDASRLGQSTPLYRNAGYWLLHGLLPLAYVGLVAWQRHRRRLEGDEAYARRRRARGEATRRLQAASEAVEQDEAPFHTLLHDAIVGFIADRLNRPAPGMTRDECRRQLTSRGVAADVVDEIDSLLERCEFGRFAPMSGSTDERRRMLEEGEQALERLREALS